MQADLKTFSALECYGASVLTAVPVQNTVGVRSIYDLPPQCIEEQLDAIFDDMTIDAVKIGMLFRNDIIKVVSDCLDKHHMHNIVVDPVMIAKSGAPLLISTAISALKELIFPLASIVTPNIPEAEMLTGLSIKDDKQMEDAGRMILNMGPEAVIVKGGHRKGDCSDCLCIKTTNVEVHWFSVPRIKTNNTHGTGCTFSAAIASYLAHGNTIVEAVHKAKKFLTLAIKEGAKYSIGKGCGPVHHFHPFWS